MRRTWQTDEMATNRKKIVEDTQMFRMFIFKHKKRKGSPTEPEIRSESASEVRNMFVSDLSALFLQIKKITITFTMIISKQMKAKSTVIDAERSAGSSLTFSVSSLDPLFPELELLALNSTSDE